MGTATAPKLELAPGWTTDLLNDLGDTLQKADPNGALAAEQRRGRADLAALAMPSRGDEDWRFTDLSPLKAILPRPLQAPIAAISALPAPAPNVVRLVLDGRHDALEGVSLPEGLSLIHGSDLQGCLGATLEATGCRDHWPVLLNGASACRLLALRVRGAVAPTLELVSDAGEHDGVLPLRILLVLEEGASLELLQVHRSRGPNLTSVVLEAQLGRGARLRHGLVALGGQTSGLLAHLAIVQQPTSELSLSCSSAGWGLARLEPRLIQAAGAARSRLRGLQLVSGRQIGDTHSQVLFGGPDGQLDQLHKVVAADAGHSIFNGAVRVPRLAQRTNAVQMSRNLLLSDRARIDTKPQLEIVADDVKCAHGATVSRLQPDQLFYLQSRGIAADQAARLLLRGFCEEVMRDLPAAASIWHPLGSWLEQETATR